MCDVTHTEEYFHTNIWRKRTQMVQLNTHKQRHSCRRAHAHKHYTLFPTWLAWAPVRLQQHTLRRPCLLLPYGQYTELLQQLADERQGNFLLPQASCEGKNKQCMDASGSGTIDRKQCLIPFDACFQHAIEFGWFFFKLSFQFWSNRWLRHWSYHSEFFVLIQMDKTRCAPPIPAQDKEMPTYTKLEFTGQQNAKKTKIKGEFITLVMCAYSVGSKSLNLEVIGKFEDSENKIKISFWAQILAGLSF